MHNPQPTMHNTICPNPHDFRWQTTIPRTMHKQHCPFHKTAMLSTHSPFHGCTIIPDQATPHGWHIPVVRTFGTTVNQRTMYHKYPIPKAISTPSITLRASHIPRDTIQSSILVLHVPLIGPSVFLLATQHKVTPLSAQSPFATTTQPIGQGCNGQSRFATTTQLFEQGCNGQPTANEARPTYLRRTDANHSYPDIPCNELHIVCISLSNWHKSQFSWHFLQWTPHGV